MKRTIIAALALVASSALAQAQWTGGGSGGGGGGGAVTVGDGADTAEGAKADTAWVSGAGSVIAILKTIAGGVTGPTPAGTNVIGHVINDAGSAVIGVVGNAIGSTTSGQSGPLSQCAVTTAAPSYTTAQTDPLSCDTAGNLRVSTTPPANASTNVAQFGGSAVATGTGAGGSGIPRVTVSNDSTVGLVAGAAIIGKVGIDQTTPGTTNGVQDAATGSTGSAVPAKAIYTGANSAGNLVGVIQADSSAAIAVSTATTTQLVALTSGKKIYVTSFDVVAAGTGNIQFVYGTGSNCGTGTTNLTGNYNLVAQAGISKGAGLGPVLVVPASNALCVTTSQAVGMAGSVSYTQF